MSNPARRGYDCKITIHLHGTWEETFQQAVDAETVLRDAGFLVSRAPTLPHAPLTPHVLAEDDPPERES
jgi:hypothetical protein